MLAGFVDELIKLSAADKAPDAAAGLGQAAPKPIAPPKPAKPMNPPKAPNPSKPIAGPRFGAPPGLKPPRLPRVSMQVPKLPAVAPKLPRPWQRPGASR
jgi:hypothetical protein